MLLRLTPKTVLNLRVTARKQGKTISEVAEERLVVAWLHRHLQFGPILDPSRVRVPLLQAKVVRHVAFEVVSVRPSSQEG